MNQLTILMRRHMAALIFIAPFCAGIAVFILTGGAAPWLSAQAQLANPAVSQALKDLPALHKEVEEGQNLILERLEDLAADIANIRADNERVVDWASLRIANLNEGLTCAPGGDCRIWLRAKRTAAGAACKVTDATPYIFRLGDINYGRPVTIKSDLGLNNLTNRFKEFPLDIIIPPLTLEGQVNFVTVIFFTDCGFSPDGYIIERRSISVPIHIKIVSNLE